MTVREEVGRHREEMTEDGEKMPPKVKAGCRNQVGMLSHGATKARQDETSNHGGEMTTRRGGTPSHGEMTAGRDGILSLGETTTAGRDGTLSHGEMMAKDADGEIIRRLGPGRATHPSRGQGTLGGDRRIELRRSGGVILHRARTVHHGKGMPGGGETMVLGKGVKAVGGRPPGKPLQAGTVVMQVCRHEGPRSVRIRYP